MAIDRKVLDAQVILEDWLVSGKPRYQLVKYIDKGSFGRIFEAEDLSIPGRRVAIKISLHPDDERIQALYEKERDFSAQLSHPHVIQISDSRVCLGHSVLVMELADHDLEQTIAQPDTNFNLDEVIRILDQACAGVAHIHSIRDGDQVLTHRDLKLSNLLAMDQNNQLVKVSDLGCVGLSGLSTTMHGTSGYRAPEGFSANPQFWPESDIYSLGVLVYAFFGKSTPYKGAGTIQELVRWKRQKTYVGKKCQEMDLPEKLTEVIVKATMPDYHDRFRSVEEFMDALRATSSSFMINGNRQMQLARKELYDLHHDLTQLLSRRYRKYGLTRFGDIDEIYTIYDHFQEHAKAHGLTGAEEYKAGSAAYQARLAHDISVCEQLVEQIKKQMDWGIHYHLAATIHLWGVADERISMVQMNDGSFKKHYDANMPKNDPNLNSKK